MPAPEAPARPGYLVRRLADAPTVACPCGPSTRLLTRADGPEINVHVTFIRDAAPHYHKRCTELYYILEGTGTLEIDGDRIPIEPGMLIRIEPHAVHRLVSEQGVRTMVIGVPALDPDDEYLV